jgi:hypothetical protein
MGEFSRGGPGPIPSRGRELSEEERQAEMREQAEHERSTREFAHDHPPWWKFWARRRT